MAYSHLNVPEGWEPYFSKYPNGYSMLEALSAWVAQVDSMVDSYNQTELTVTDYTGRMDDFIVQYDTSLHDTLAQTLTEWQTSGLLEVIIEQSLQTEMDVLDAQMSVVSGQVTSKVGGGVLANLADLSQEVKTSMTGGSVAVVGVDAVNTVNVIDKAVTPDKLDGILTTSGNYYNPDTRSNGFKLDNATGNLVADAAYTTSDYIFVKGLSDRFIAAIEGSYGSSACYYGSAKVFMSGVDNIAYSNGRKTPANVIWMRIDMPLASGATNALAITKTQLTAPPTFTPYVRKLDRVNIDYTDVLGTPEIVNNLTLGESQTIVGIPQETIAIGTNAARHPENASLAIGTGALQNLVAATTDNDNGKFNTAVGHAAGKNTTLGDHNTDIGWSAGADNTTGDGNTNVGEDAGLHNVTGSANTNVGNRAGQSGKGDRNTRIGGSAGFFGTGVPTGDGNSSLGYGSGPTDGAGEYNVHLGYWCQPYGDINNSIGIGYNVSTTKSNQVVIGNNAIEENVFHGKFKLFDGNGVAYSLYVGTDGLLKLELFA